MSKILAPQVGLEPTTLRLTAECSAIELLRNTVTHGSKLKPCANHFYNKTLCSRQGVIPIIREEPSTFRAFKTSASSGLGKNATRRSSTKRTASFRSTYEHQLAL